MEKQKNNEQEAPNINSEHIKEEFYKWFESRGLLSDLRAYMRQLMVKALEESNKLGKAARQRKSSSSPKLQAINLIVVDYLFHEEYLYTVSVFASEAQILESLPQYSEYITQTVRERRWDPSTMPRFSQLETEDILDTLRMPPTQCERQKATNLYLSGSESLLTCIVRTLASSHTQSVVEDRVVSGPAEVPEAECSHQLWSQEMQNLLLLAGVKLQHIKRMQQRWAQTIEEEKQQAKKEVEVEVAEQQVGWQQETEQRLRSELVEQLRAEQQELRERQSRLELRERGLASLAEQLTAVHDDINERMSQLQLQNEELRVREARQQSDRLVLDQRFSQLQIREEHLNKSYSNFRDQTDAGAYHVMLDGSAVINTNTAAGADKTSTDASVQASTDAPERVSVCTQTPEPVAAAFTQTVDTEDQEQQTSLDIDVDPQLVQQLQTDRDRINELQEENLELRAFALQQRHRIDELTNRAASLSNQLEESRIAVAVLSGRESAVVVAQPQFAPTNNPPVVITPTFGFNTPQRTGAGEENIFVARPRQATPRPDSRRRPSRFAFSQNPTPTSEESSPTDEVIQNARTRIQQLEQESAVVQRNFQDFQHRLLSTDSVMFPPLGAPRTRNPLVRVRGSNISPFVPYSSVLQRNQSTQPTQTEPYNDNDESSSDQTAIYERNRVDSLIRARRVFNQRNIRQLERWKQFKKKFQRRDFLDQSRRNTPAAFSLTSSEDDDDSINARKKQNLTKHKKCCDSKQANLSNKHTEDSQVMFRNNLAAETSTENNQPFSSENVSFAADQNITAIPKSISDKKLSLDHSKLKQEVERTEKLIESVKVLLADQIKNKGISTSNGSFQIDSLPRDSPSGSHLEEPILNAHNSLDPLITEHEALLPIQKTSEEVVTFREVRTENVGSPNNLFYRTADPQQSLPNVSVMQSNKENSDGEDQEVLVDKQSNIPEPLNVPTLRLVSPGLNVEGEDFTGAEAFNTGAVAEHENEGTTSVTSGSDILRELNPSKTESSNSLVSVGWAEDSKHSSDFWN